MQGRLVAYLLQILDTKHIEGSENTASTKAQIVKTLKAMTMSLEYGEEVRIWIVFGLDRIIIKEILLHSDLFDLRI